MARRSQSDSNSKDGAKCTSFLNDTLIDPNSTNPLRPCYFGQDAVDGNCPRSGQLNNVQCKCLPKQEVERLWSASRNSAIGMGSALIAVSSIIILVMMLKWQRMNDRVEKRRAWMIWSIFLAPLVLTGYGLYYLIPGLLIKTDQYWVGCG